MVYMKCSDCKRGWDQELAGDGVNPHDPTQPLLCPHCHSDALFAFVTRAEQKVPLGALFCILFSIVALAAIYVVLRGMYWGG